MGSRILYVDDDRANLVVFEAAFGDELDSPPLPEAQVSFDHRASPWHTVCEVEAPDKPSLLHILATAFTAAGVDVVSATVTGHEGVAYDRFELTDSDGGKLDAEAEEAIVRFVTGGVTTRRRRFRSAAYMTQ
jgi:hypothetical protein